MRQNEQTQRVARMLEAAIQAFGLTDQDLEKRMGWHEGALSDILEGRAEIHSDHVLAILDGLSLDSRPPGFEEEEDLDDSGSFLVEELIGRSRLLGFDPEESEAPDYPPPDGVELERRIRSVLREAFGAQMEVRARSGAD